MKTKTETITPLKAAQILEAHWVKEHQRKPNEDTVRSYARSMRAGQWLMTHQGIAVDDAGELIDGVHRLLAVIQAGVAVDMMVTRDIPHNGNASGIFTIDAIDRGRERGVGQQLQLRHGVRNGNLVSAVCRGVLWLAAASQKMLIGKFTVANALRVMDIYAQEVAYTMDTRSSDPGVRNAAVIAASAFAMKACKSQVQDFYQKLATGEDIRNGDPAMTCRRWLMNSVTKTGTLIEYRGVLTCAMKHVLQEKLTKLYDTEHGYNFFLEKQRQSVSKLLGSCGFAG